MFNTHNMEIKVKKLNAEAVIPTYAHETGDACLDLTAISTEVDNYGNLVCHFGLALEIPDGYVGLIFPRSSICKKEMMLTNSVGVVDSSYRGEITAKFKPIIGIKHVRYEAGERVAQLMVIPYPHIELTEVEELSETERGTGGYGSTGK